MKSLVFLFLISCNGFFSSRAKLKGVSALSPKSSEWVEMYRVYESKCLSCHSSFGSSEAEFLANGLAVPGKPEESKIVTKLKNNPYSQSGNMPKGGISWSESETEVFVKWVNSIKSTLPEFVIKTSNKAILNGDVIDLGLYFINGSIESSKKFTIVNTSTEILSVDDIELESHSFFKVRESENTQLQPGESFDFWIEFSSENMGAKRDILLVQTNQGEVKFSIKAKGSSILKSAGVNCSDRGSKLSKDYIKPLLKHQFINHLGNILGELGENILGNGSVKAFIDFYPKISLKEYLKNDNGGLLNGHSEAVASISINVAKTIRLEKLKQFNNQIGGSCEGLRSVDNIGMDCFTKIAQEVSKIAWSRLITQSELEKVLEVAQYYIDEGSHEYAYESVIAGILIHPETWMMIDEGSQYVAYQEYQRTAKGFIRLLSFTLTDSSPDAFLVGESLKPNLFDKQNVASLVEYLKTKKDNEGNFLYSNKSVNVIGDYLGLDGNSGYGSSNALIYGLLDSYRRDHGVDTSKTKYGTFELDNKLADQFLLRYLVDESSGSVEDLLLSPYKVSLNPTQKFVNKTEGTGVSAQRVDSRPGTGIFLNNATFANSNNSFYRSPPHTANIVIQKFGCQSIGEPEGVPGLEPDDLKPPEADPSYTVSEVFNAATSQSQVCLNCHKTLNSYSDVLQGVNSIGEITDTEAHYNQEGVELSSHYLNTKSNIAIHGHFFEVDNVYDLAKVFHESGSFGLCLTKEFTKIAYQSSDVEKLGCQVEDNLGVLMSNKPVKEFFSEIVKDENFTKIRFDEDK